MSIFRIVKYSSILFFLGKYKSKLFRVVAVLLFALVTSLLYQDVADYLQQQHPETVVYALIAKIIIVYGALVFVLLQFRPEADTQSTVDTPTRGTMQSSSTAKPASSTTPNDRLAGLEDVTKKITLRSRYDKVIDGDGDHNSGRNGSSPK
ncbi:MAG: hypothetical protein IMF06_11360 [Proteobacteria bacterium]|nr:hypothetical protein [Pseudomonadota bacterium]